MRNSLKTMTMKQRTADQAVARSNRANVLLMNEFAELIPDVTHMALALGATGREMGYVEADLESSARQAQAVRESLARVRATLPPEEPGTDPSSPEDRAFGEGPYGHGSFGQ